MKLTLKVHNTGLFKTMNLNVCKCKWVMFGNAQRTILVMKNWKLYRTINTYVYLDECQSRLALLQQSELVLMTVRVGLCSPWWPYLFHLFESVLMFLLFSFLYILHISLTWRLTCRCCADELWIWLGHIDLPYTISMTSKVSY